MRRFKVNFTPPFFANHSAPHGKLPRVAGAQALWYYMMLATQSYKKETEQLVYEGDKDYVAPYARHWMNCAMMYGVDPNEMANYWDVVEQEIDRVNVERVLSKGEAPFKKLPDEVKYPKRHRTVN